MQRNTTDSKEQKSSTALMLHAEFFKNEDDVFTSKGMKEKLESTKVISTPGLIANGTMFAAYHAGCPHAKVLCRGYFESEELKKLRHPGDTGIFDENGNFNEEAFNKLASYAIEHKETGRKILSQQHINEFKAKDSHPERWKDASRFDQWLGKNASDGEFSSTFKALPIVKVNNVEHIFVDDLKNFYLDSRPVFEALAAKRKASLQEKIPIEPVALAPKP